MTGRIRKALFASFVVLASSLLAIAMCEVYARAVYTKPWYDRLLAEQSRPIDFTAFNNAPRPDSFTSFGRKFFMRPIALPLAKSHATRRVLFLGDSFTYGLGILDESKAFPSLIGQRFEESKPLPAVRSLEIINGGLPGSLTKDWVALAEQLLDKWHPDVVVIVFFLRDGTRTNSIPDFFGAIRTEIVQRNSASRLYQDFYAYRAIRDSLDRRTVADLYADKFIRSYFGGVSDTEEWDLAQKNVLRIRDMSRERSMPVGFVVFPILAELDENYPFRRICNLLIDFAKVNQMPAHSLLPAFQGKFGPDLWISPFDQHPNAAAHRLAADSMYRFTIELVAKTT